MAFSGSPTAAEIAQHVRACLTPVQCYNKIPYDAMKLNREKFETPGTFSLLMMPSVGCMHSALKKAEDHDELIIRIYNPDEQQNGEGMVACTLPVVSWWETGMDENPLQQQTERAGEFVRVRPCQSRTFSLAIER